MCMNIYIYIYIYILRGVLRGGLRKARTRVTTSAGATASPNALTPTPGRGTFQHEWAACAQAACSHPKGPKPAQHNKDTFQCCKHKQNKHLLAPGG